MDNSAPLASPLPPRFSLGTYWWKQLLPALANGLVCAAGAAWLGLEIVEPSRAGILGLMGGIFGFLNRMDVFREAASPPPHSPPTEVEGGMR